VLNKLRVAPRQLPGLALGFVIIGVLTVIIMAKDMIDLLRRKG
jgi:hypothetical protein